MLRAHILKYSLDNLYCKLYYHRVYGFIDEYKCKNNYNYLFQGGMPDAPPSYEQSTASAGGE